MNWREVYEKETEEISNFAWHDTDEYVYWLERKLDEFDMNRIIHKQIDRLRCDAIAHAIDTLYAYRHTI